MKARAHKKSPRNAAPAASSRLHVLEGATLAVFFLLVTSTFGITSLQGTLVREGESAAVVSAVLVDLANSDRQTRDLNSLTVSPILTAAAQAKANDMAAKGYFAHNSPDGRDPWYWFTKAGYSYLYAGENLAVDFSDSGDVEKAWMNSTEHRANLLDAHYTEIGIATAAGTYQGHPTVFIVQLFGRPRPALPVENVNTMTAGYTPTLAHAAAPKNASKVLGVAAEAAPNTQAMSLTTASPIDPRTAARGASMPAKVVEQRSNVWERIITSPKTALLDAYYILGILILAFAFYVTRFEFRAHHTKRFVYSAALLMLMCAFFTAADIFVFSQPAIAQSLASISTR